MKKKLAAVLMLGVLCTPMIAAAAPNEARAEAKARKNPFRKIPVTGTAMDGSRFVGTMDIHGFVTDAAGHANAIGVLNGRLGRQAVDNAVVTMKVLSGADAAARGIGTQAVCNILHLVLGPLDLDLLGLVVHLDQVELIIDAVSGAGNLLGNLLCAIVNLLNGGILGDILTTLLNRLLALLEDILGGL